MRKNRLREIWAAGGSVINGWLAIPSAFSAETMASLLRLTAWLCEEFDLAPADVIRHYDVTGKVCPKYYVDHPEAWEDFRSALRAARTQENPS